MIYLHQPFTLIELCKIIGETFDGDGSYVLDNVATLDDANERSITFIDNPLYLSNANNTKSRCVIVPANHAKADVNCNKIVSKNPRLTLCNLLTFIEQHSPRKTQDNFIDDTALIHESAVIGSNVQIGKSVIIGAKVCIGDNVIIGDETVIKAGAIIAEDCFIGSQCIIHQGAVIGSDGFGFAKHSGGWKRMPHLGKVVIGNNVDIGANTTIDRGMISNTIVEDGALIDNQVQIAHNVKIGKYTGIAACVGIAGSASIGSNCQIGGGVGIAGHLDICDGTVITAFSGVSKSISEPGIYSSGIPAKNHVKWMRSLARLNELDEIFKKIKQLESQNHG